MKPNCQNCSLQGTRTCETCPFPVTSFTPDDLIGDYGAAGKHSQYERWLATSQTPLQSEDDVLAERSIAV